MFFLYRIVTFVAQDYSESEQISNKMKDDNIFIYNQSQNPSSGSRGIACIALAIINHSEESCDNLSKKCDEMFESKKFEEMVSSCMIDNKGKTHKYFFLF